MRKKFQSSSKGWQWPRRWPPLGHTEATSRCPFADAATASAHPGKPKFRAVGHREGDKGYFALHRTAGVHVGVVRWAAGALTEIAGGQLHGRRD
jgi:hypothetical protein